MRLLLIAALALAGTACDHDEGMVGCTNNTQCPEGNICDAGRCRVVCSDDGDCSRGTICVDSICEQGTRTGAPDITGVIGDGSQNCTDSPDDRCFGDAIHVQGERLLGASFRLDNQGTGPSFTNLGIGSTNTDIQVEVELPTDLVPGSYLLVAANAAGSDQVDVQILQGEPGPALTGQEMLTAINTEGTGMFVVARLPTANDVITHINSGSIKIDPSLLPPDGGTAYDADDIVGLVNSASINIYSERLGRDANDVISRINGGTTRFDADLLPPVNDILTYLNTGTVVLGTHIAPGGGGTGSMTGDQIINAINTEGTTRINSARLNVGTSATDVAAGNHTHTGSDIASGTVPFARLPAGTTSTSVAVGNHTHPGGGSSRLVISDVGPGSQVAISRAEIDPLCQDEDGCRVRIGYSGFTYGTTDDPPGILWGLDCPIHIEGNDWLVSYSCNQHFSVTVPSGGVFQPYYTHIFDPDNDNDANYSLVLGYNAGGEWVCNLTDNPMTGTSDNALGFYFWTRSAAVTDYFDLPGRACHLVIED
jgi:Cys-rich repeat protein